VPFAQRSWEKLQQIRGCFDLYGSVTYGHLMPISQGSARNVVQLAEAAEARAQSAPAVPDEVSASPLYGVAMLKIAMELKRTPQRSLEELITGVLARMQLPEDDFRAYLNANGGLLRTVVAKRGY
jgi:hypothetical protein